MKSREGVVLILRDAGGHIALQLRDDIPNTWGLFGGWMEEGEAPKAAAVRELEEELSVQLAPHRFQFIGTHEEQGRFFAYIYHVVVNDDLDGAVLGEGLAWGFLSGDEISHMNLLPHHRDMLDLYGSLW